MEDEDYQINAYFRQQEEAYYAELDAAYAEWCDAAYASLILDTQPFVPQLPLLIG